VYPITFLLNTLLYLGYFYCLQRGENIFMDYITNCIDAGSDYCPCYLAETDDCLTCTHLQNRGFCDCSWSGVCIYQEYVWCGNKKKNFRQEVEGSIVEKKLIGEKGVLLKIKVSKTLARQLKNPGSFVFIRNPNKPPSFNVPMSIMYTDEFSGEIMVAIQVLGIKTKTLADLKEKVIVKGPFWNGILGLKHLKNSIEENVLVVARGIALAPTNLVVQYLLSKKNKVTFVVDPGKVGEIFIKDYLNHLNLRISEVNLRDEYGMKKVKNLIHSGDYKILFSGGADKLHKMLLEEINVSEKPIKFVSTNNHPLCCGEGICGSCISKTPDSSSVKMCKCQIDIESVLKKGDTNG